MVLYYLQGWLVAGGEGRLSTAPIKIVGMLSGDGKTWICSWGPSVFGRTRQMCDVSLGPPALTLLVTFSLNPHFVRAPWTLSEA